MFKDVEYGTLFNASSQSTASLLNQTIVQNTSEPRL